MPTVAEIGRRTYYHATPANNIHSILAHGIKPLAWLTTTKGDAYQIISDYKYDSRAEAGSIKVFRIMLPSDWELAKGPLDEFISYKTIPPQYIRLIS